jgi:hypothetical protein
MNATDALKKIVDLTKPGQEVSLREAIDIICDVYNLAREAVKDD